MKKIIYLILIILLISCIKESSILTNKTLIIPKDILSTEKNIQLESCCKDITTIPLETNQEILIQSINNIYLYQNILFILHDDQLSCFNMQGKFLRKIGNKGNGPMEYSHLPESIVFYDNYILLNDRLAHKLLIYTIQGNYIKTIDTKHNISQFKVFNKDLIVGYIPNNNGKEPNKLYAYNWKGDIIDSIKNNIIYNNFNSYIKYDSEHPMFLTNDKLIGFKETFCDTFYTINHNLTLKPFLIYDLGDLTPKPEDIYNEKDILKMFLQDKLVLTVLFDNHNYMVFSTNKSRFTCILWDKTENCIHQTRFLYNPNMAKLFDKEKSSKQFGTNTYILKDGTPYFMPQFVSEDNKYLISYETSATNEDDNPIIVLAEIK